MRRRAVAVLAGIGVLAASAAFAAPKPPPITGTGVCDVDGVTSSYETTFDGDAYVVSTAVVGMLDAACLGASVEVGLKQGSVTIATGQATSDGEAEVEVPMVPRPRAEAVDQISLVVRGGDTPVPEACRSLTLTNVRIGTPNADAFDLTKDADLSYGLGGADRIGGANERDCVVGGAGDDDLRGDNHGDVLLGGDGNDRLDGGVQADALYGEAGDDHLVGGQQDDALYGGPGADRLDGGPGKDTCNGGGDPPSVTNVFIACETVQP